MEIVSLTRHPHLAPELARLASRAWSHLYASWSDATALAEYRAARDDGPLPVTLVAVEAGHLLGTVSLVVNDLPGREDLNPWLASLLVVPDARGRGVGQALVRAAEAHLRDRGFVTAYLFTESAGKFFEKLGWRVLGPGSSHGSPVTLYERSVGTLT